MPAIEQGDKSHDKHHAEGMRAGKKHQIHNRCDQDPEGTEHFLERSQEYSPKDDLLKGSDIGEYHQGSGDDFLPISVGHQGNWIAKIESDNAEWEAAQRD